jgi:hypothetical protein
VFLKKNVTETQQSEECDAEEEVLVAAAQNPEGIFSFYQRVLAQLF